MNAAAPLSAVELLAGALAPGGRRQVCLLSSRRGSRAWNGGGAGGGEPPADAYGLSKLALNDRFRAAEPQWRARHGITAVLMHPGWVRTDMGGAAADLSVEESATAMQSTLARLAPSDAGKFLRWDGTEHLW